jgi:hypothetical protein
VNALPTVSPRSTIRERALQAVDDPEQRLDDHVVGPTPCHDELAVPFAFF